MIFKSFYKNVYFVSNYGHILRYGKLQNGYNIKEPRFVKPSISKGYYTIAIRINKKNKTYRVHSIVAKAFLGDMPENKNCINHKDGNKLNNNISNLEYVTYLENRKHAISLGLSVINPNQKLTIAEIKKIRREFKLRPNSNAKFLALKYGVTHETIRRVAK